MNAALHDIAKRVNWYTDPKVLLDNVDLFLCQVMARGSTEDVIAVQQHFSLDDFKKAYRAAPPGLFTKRAWAYWGLALLGDPDIPMPERFPGGNQFDWRKST